MYYIEEPTEVYKEGDTPCGEVDWITEAVCTRPVGHQLPHTDESDWGCIVNFPDKPDPLYVPPTRTVREAVVEEWAEREEDEWMYYSPFFMGPPA